MAVTSKSKVHVIPSCIEPSHYSAKSKYDVGATPVAIWVGSPGTEPYLQTVAPALLKLNKSIGLRLVIVSSGNAELGPLQPMVDRVEWSLSRVGAEMVKADVGIMPMLDDPWTRGKCGYKLLQYAAAGLPCVGSPVGVNRQVLSNIGGRSASPAPEWAEQILDLIEMGQRERRSLGTRMSAAVRRHYSYEAWGPAWREAVLGRG
ncbi:glycosyltransferase [Terrabacter lapilli]